MSIEREAIFILRTPPFKEGNITIHAESITIYKTDCARSPIEIHSQCEGFDAEAVYLTPEMVKVIREATDENGRVRLPREVPDPSAQGVQNVALSGGRNIASSSIDKISKGLDKQ